MIDLETLDVTPTATILTMGAVKFDPFGDDVAENITNLKKDGKVIGRRGRNGGIVFPDTVFKDKSPVAAKPVTVESDDSDSDSDSDAEIVDLPI